VRPLRLWCLPMNIIQCSICRRAAAWMIDSEVFCEGHKEAIIENFGVDRFPIRRLTNAERAFRVGGRFSKTAGKKKGSGDATRR
jgi:hypothetical protein